MSGGKIPDRTAPNKLSDAAQQYADEARALAKEFEGLAAIFERRKQGSKEFSDARRVLLKHSTVALGWEGARGARMHVLREVHWTAGAIRAHRRVRQLVREKLGEPADEIDRWKLGKTTPEESERAKGVVAPLLRRATTQAARASLLKSVSADEFKEDRTGLVEIACDEIAAIVEVFTGKRVAPNRRTVAAAIEAWPRRGGPRSKRTAPKKWEAAAELMKEIGLPISHAALQQDWTKWPNC